MRAYTAALHSRGNVGTTNMWCVCPTFFVLSLRHVLPTEKLGAMDDTNHTVSMGGAAADGGGGVDAGDPPRFLRPRCWNACNSWTPISQHTICYPIVTESLKVKKKAM